MRPRVYVIVLLLLIPLQASLFNPLSLAGVKPDLGLALLFIVGLIAGPAEGALAGIAMGLLLDIGSASVLGLTGITRGLIGLSAGLLGKRVLDFRSPANSIFLAVFTAMEGIFIAVFMQVFYGSVPFFSLLSGRIIPQALYTALLGFALLQLLRKKGFIAAFQQRAMHKES